MAKNTTERSDILLLCLGPDTDSTSISSVSVKDLFQVFSSFGALRKVIIFKKKILLKAFLQFRKVESAERAKNELHEGSLNNFGRAKLYFSALQELAFSNKYLEYKEFSLKESNDPEDVAPIFAPPLNLSTEESLKKSMTNVTEASATKSQDSIDVKSKSPEPSLLSFSDSNAQKTTRCILSDLKSTNKLNSVFSFKSIGENQNSTPLSKPLLQKGSNFVMVSKENSQPAEKPSLDLDSNVQQLPSKVILISNLFGGLESVAELFNVFSCFGNIFKILLMKNLKKALIEYTSIEFAKVAQSCMNNQIVGSSRIRVNFSRYKKIDLKKNNKSEKSQQFNEVMVASKNMHRFQPEASEPHIPPSSNLLVVCEKKTDLLPIDIYLQIQSVMKPLNFKVLGNDKEVLPAANSYRIIVSFSNTQQAIGAMGKLQNSEVKGLPLKVSFAPYNAK